MDISIFGLGYVGAVSLACLARDGHTVWGVDVDSAKLEMIAAGRTPVVEEGMVELMRDVVGTGRVHVTADARLAMANSTLSMICVGTPSAPSGRQDQSALLRLAADLGVHLRSKPERHIFVFRSTMVPGTLEDVLRPIIETASGKKEGVDFYVCSQPEFLREGTSVRDYDKPPFTIVGANNDVPIAALKNLFGHLPCRFCATSIRGAEMLKYACNAFHALKITFANEIARTCEAVNVDPFSVMELVCQDTQLNISRAYLKPGFAFGGSCLPKDLRALQSMAKMRDVNIPMLNAILLSNRSQLEHAMQKVMMSRKRRIGMLGLSFKAGTDDLRESPLVLLAEYFYGKGLNLLVYDPEVQLSSLLGANRRFIDEHLPHIGRLMRDDLSAVIRESEIIVVGFADVAMFEVLERELREDQIVVDLAHIPDRAALRAQYQGLCWS